MKIANRNYSNYISFSIGLQESCIEINRGEENGCLTEDVISKQTVKKEIHNLEVKKPQKLPKEKKTKNLYIQIYDKAHVTKQLWNQ